jgi:hypothetical protein
MTQEYADMRLIFGEARVISAEAERLCAERFPYRLTPGRRFVHQLWIGAFAYICLFPC